MLLSNVSNYWVFGLKVKKNITNNFKIKQSLEDFFFLFLTNLVFILRSQCQLCIMSNFLINPSLSTQSTLPHRILSTRSKEGKFLFLSFFQFSQLSLWPLFVTISNLMMDTTVCVKLFLSIYSYFIFIQLFYLYTVIYLYTVNLSLNRTL